MRDCGRKDDGVGLPGRALRAVAVPRGVLCNKRADYKPNSNIVFVIPQQIHETRDNSAHLGSVNLDNECVSIKRVCLYYQVNYF